MLKYKYLLITSICKSLYIRPNTYNLLTFGPEKPSPGAPGLPCTPGGPGGPWNKQTTYKNK